MENTAQEEHKKVVIISSATLFFSLSLSLSREFAP